MDTLINCLISLYVKIIIYSIYINKMKNYTWIVEVKNPTENDKSLLQRNLHRFHKIPSHRAARQRFHSKGANRLQKDRLWPNYALSTIIPQGGKSSRISNGQKPDALNNPLPQNN